MCFFKLNVFEFFLISGECLVLIIEFNYVLIWLVL